MPKKDKDLAKIQVAEDKPSQLSLFEILDSKGKNDYSNTIEIYDALPKHVWSTQRERTDLENAVITRRCVIRGREYISKVKPAIIEKPDGTTVLIYPGEREELVEDALRKLAASGQGHILEGKTGVIFTLYELQKELARMGHGFNFAEIKEAILVCRGATLECIDENEGEALISGSFFQMIGLTNRSDFLKKGADAKCYVQFHPLVNDSIMKLTFRQYNYRIAMQIRSPLARFIYKRMSNFWTQADPGNPYTPSLLSFLTQSPREMSPRMPENIRAMKNALDILIKEEIVRDYEATRVKDGKKIADVRYTIWPHPNFVKEMKRANAKKRETDIKAIEMGLKPKRIT